MKDIILKLSTDRLLLYKGLDINVEKVPFSFHIARAISLFENETGWKPFFQKDLTVELDVPELSNENLSLPSNILSLNSITYKGLELSSNAYRITKTDQDKIFLFGRYDLNYPMVVSGTFGYDFDTNIPENVLFGVSSLVLHNILRNTSLPTGDLEKIKEQSVMYEFDNSSGRSETERLKSEYDETVECYRRFDL